MQTIGIIGGLGPQTTGDFFLKIIELSRKQNKIQNPSILIFNLPIPKKVEQDLAVNGQNMNNMLPFLMDGVKKLETARVDFMVIPCNTVHVFIDKLRKSTTIPILSIIEETTKVVTKNNLKKVGLLASKQSIKSQLFKPISSQQIEIILPNSVDQGKIAKIIGNLLSNKIKENDKNTLVKIIKKMKNQCAQAVILGCTDLPLLIKQKDSPLPLINTLDILAQAATNKALKGKK